MPKFLTIIGPQAVGKMTVGQELAKITDYKLFYNHMTIEFTRLIFDYDKEAFKNANIKIRELVFEEFAKSNEKGIIFTGCLDFSEQLEEELQELKVWTKGYDEVYVVELETTLEERLKRNKTENRLLYKPSKRDIEWSEQDLLNSMENHKFNSEEGQGQKIFKNYLKIDNTNISAEDVAKMIKEKFNL